MPPAPTPSPTGSPHAGSSASARPEPGLPDDLRAWIDAHDPPIPGDADEVVEADDADEAGDRLAEQRAEHEPDRSSSSGTDSGTNEVLGDLVNNTGDDGGAASG